MQALSTAADGELPSVPVRQDGCFTSMEKRAELLGGRQQGARVIARSTVGRPMD